VFSRREDNTVVFVCILVGKGKEYFSQYLKSFCRYTASVLKVLDFHQTTVLDKKLAVCSVLASDFMGIQAFFITNLKCKGAQMKQMPLMTAK